MSKGNSIVFDFKGIRDACDAISTDIMGPRADKMHECPICDQYMYNDEDDNPVENDGVIRCEYCGGIDKPKQVPQKKLIKDGYIPPPPNCAVCMDVGYTISGKGINGVASPCQCPAGAAYKQSLQGRPVPAAPPIFKGGGGGGGMIKKKSY